MSSKHNDAAITETNTHGLQKLSLKNPKVTQMRRFCLCKQCRKFLSCLATHASRTSCAEHQDHSRNPAPVRKALGKKEGRPEEVRTRQDHHHCSQQPEESRLAPCRSHECFTFQSSTLSSVLADNLVQELDLWNLRRLHSCTWVPVTVIQKNKTHHADDELSLRHLTCSRNENSPWVPGSAAKQRCPSRCRNTESEAPSLF